MIGLYFGGLSERRRNGRGKDTSHEMRGGGVFFI